MSILKRIGSSLGMKLAGLVVFGFLLVGNVHALTAPAPVLWTFTAPGQSHQAGDLLTVDTSLVFNLDVQTALNLTFQVWDMDTNAQNDGLEPLEVSIHNGFGGTMLPPLADITLHPGDYFTFTDSFLTGNYSIKLDGYPLPDGGAYQLRVTSSPVPLPAAAWLFGSGLLGLIGFGKRKKAA